MGLNRFQIENSTFRIDGYYLPRPEESPETTFARAKKELREAILRDLSDADALSLDQFLSERRRAGV